MRVSLLSLAGAIGFLAGAIGFSVAVVGAQEVPVGGGDVAIGTSPPYQSATSSVDVPSRAGAGLLNINVDNSVPRASSKSVGVSLASENGTNVSGIADVMGFPDIDSGAWGKIDWKVEGSNVTGTLYDREGALAGTFQGTITKTGLSGKITHRDGRTGWWSWKGPAPQ